ncbi:LEA domain protein [Ophiocordyceps sinensis CO18]|nr:LEA domain protein [Ophiocordyceps sinensis CO18]
MITDKIDSAERKPKDELDEEQLVKEVKPLIEEGHRVLTETNGAIRGLDPDGRIQRNAKQKAGTRDATPEEHHLAEVLKELTGTVSQTIDNARRKIEGMPHAKKELNPLWGLLSEPLFQILAAVGLLLNGVLGLVGRLLGGLGLGGLVDKLLGGLGLNKILGSLGLGGALDALTGKKK